MASADWKVRSPRGDGNYWQTWVRNTEDWIAQNWQSMQTPAENAGYEAQYARKQAQRHLKLMLRLYSAGAPISEMAPWFEGLLAAWERSQTLEPTVYPPEIVHSRRTWSVNFDLYGESAWLISLALLLEIPNEQWQRLLTLIGNEGEDAVLDALIASREPGRRIGERVLYPKPYARLHAVFMAQPEARPSLLRDFVEHWYPELDRKATKGRPAIYNRPYWYTLGDENFEGGAYFGRWCLEAAAAAKALGMDDSLCCGHEHYPGDLLRPGGPSTHPGRTFAPAPPPIPWWRRALGMG